MRAPSPAMWARAAAGLVAVAAFAFGGQATRPWVWLPVMAAAVFLVLGVDRLSRRYMRGARRGEVLRTADLLVASAAAVMFFVVALAPMNGDLAGWLGPPAVMAAVLVTSALPRRLTRSSDKVPGQRLMIYAALALPAVLTAVAAGLERTDLVGLAAMPVAIFVVTVTAAMFPEDGLAAERSESRTTT